MLQRCNNGPEMFVRHNQIPAEFWRGEKENIGKTRRRTEPNRRHMQDFPGGREDAPSATIRVFTTGFSMSSLIE